MITYLWEEGGDKLAANGGFKYHRGAKADALRVFMREVGKLSGWLGTGFPCTQHENDLRQTIVLHLTMTVHITHAHACKYA